MKEFIEYLVKQVVSKPEVVMVVTSAGEGEQTLYTIDVDPEDMGVIIGREGKTINSIRNLARAKAIKDNVHIKIILNEPAGSVQSTDAQV